MKSECVVTKLKYISSNSDKYMIKRIKEEGLPILNNHVPLFYILSSDNKGFLFNEVADIWNLSKSSLSDIVNKYHKSGLVEKHICTEDRRTVYISLTKEGNEIKIELDKLKEEFLELIMATLNSSSRDEFDKFIDQILKNSNSVQ